MISSRRFALAMIVLAIVPASPLEAAPSRLFPMWANSYLQAGGNDGMLAVGDFDTNGALDVAIDFPPYYVVTPAVLNADYPGLLSTVDYLPGGAAWDLLAVDFEDDGDLDLLTPHQTFTNAGGSFTPEILVPLYGTQVGGEVDARVMAPGVVGACIGATYSSGQFPGATSAYVYTFELVDGEVTGWAEEIMTFQSIRGVAVADFDANGTWDVALALEGNQIRVSYRSGGGVTHQTISLPHPVTSLVAADIDIDGDPDLVAGISGSVSADGGVSVVKNNDGGWNPTSYVDPSVGVNAIAVGDLDLDLIPDVLVTTSLESFKVHRGLGGGLLAAADAPYPLVDRDWPHDGPAVNAALADMDLDGVLDVVLVRSLGMVEIYSNNLDVDVTAPTVAVTWPNAGESLGTGLQRSIQWDAHDAYYLNDTRVTIELSRDGGASYTETLASNLPDTGEFLWTVTGPPSDECRIRVRVTDPQHNAAEDVCDQDFVIPAPPLSVDDTATPRLWLSPVTPNPGRAPLSFRYELARKGDTRLEIFDSSGRLVRRLVSGSQDAGAHHLTWDGRDEAARAMPNGVYWARLSPGNVRARRFVLMD